MLFPFLKALGHSTCQRARQVLDCPQAVSDGHQVGVIELLALYGIPWEPFLVSHTNRIEIKKGKFPKQLLAVWVLAGKNKISLEVWRRSVAHFLL